MSEIQKIAEKSATKPVYIMIVENPVNRTFNCYKVDHLDTSNSSFVIFKGFEISKSQSDKLKNNINTKIAFTEPVNMYFPWHRVVSIDNLTYSQTKRMEIKNGKEQ